MAAGPMKSSRSSISHCALGLLALALVVSVPVLRAEDAKPRKVTPATKAYDADGDGILNETEAEKAKEGARAKAKATREANLAKYDTNKDGKLDDAEKAKRNADQKAAKAKGKTAVEPEQPERD